MKRVVRFIIFLVCCFCFIPCIRVEAKVTQTEVSKYALKWDGHKEMLYQYGGPGGRKEGLLTLEECSAKGAKFDCSGFVMMVYRHFGIEVGDSSPSMLSKAVKIVSEEEAVPGDVCWWSGHVGIYIGDGKIVHTNTKNPPTNYVHVSEFSTYRYPEKFLRMVDDVEKLKPLSGSDSEDTQKEVESIDGYGSIITESDLTGMPIESFVEQYQKSLQFADSSQLSVSQKKELEVLKSNKNNISGAESIAISIFHGAEMFVGMCCVLYGLLLVVAYLFDYFNVYIDISMLGIITFGKFKLMEQEESNKFKKYRGYNKTNGKTYVTLWSIIFRASVLIFIGVALLMSGFLVRFFVMVMEFIKGFFR